MEITGRQGLGPPRVPQQTNAGTIGLPAPQPLVFPTCPLWEQGGEGSRIICCFLALPVGMDPTITDGAAAILFGSVGPLSEQTTLLGQPGHVLSCTSTRERPAGDFMPIALLDTPANQSVRWVATEALEAELKTTLRNPNFQALVGERGGGSAWAPFLQTQLSLLLAPPLSGQNPAGVRIQGPRWAWVWQAM